MPTIGAYCLVCLSRNGRSGTGPRHACGIWDRGHHVKCRKRTRHRFCCHGHGVSHWSECWASFWRFDSRCRRVSSVSLVVPRPYGTRAIADPLSNMVLSISRTSRHGNHRNGRRSNSHTARTSTKGVRKSQSRHHRNDYDHSLIIPSQL